ncbi:MAG: hypothetical protein OXG72_20755 [Acidobacteria bacterium]|nr:hypothetical protein [Acidobacteriota bacterium]
MGATRSLGLSGVVVVTVAYTGHVPADATVTMDRDQTADFALEPGAPPFAKEPGSSTPRLIEPDDPSSFRSVEYAGPGTRDIFDRRIGAWTTAEVFLFDVQYSGREREFQVNIEFGSVEAARRQVDTYAPAFGQLPAFLADVRSAPRRCGYGTSRCACFRRTTRRRRGSPLRARWSSDGFHEEVLIHEAAHVSLDRLHAMTPAWGPHKEADAAFVSTYARDHPDRMSTSAGK